MRGLLRRICAAGLSLLAVVAVAAPPGGGGWAAGATVQGAAEREGGGVVARGAAKVIVPAPAGAECCIVRVTTGKEPGGAVVVLRPVGGAPAQLYLRPRDLKLRSGQVLPDACIEYPWGGRLFVRPNAEFYKEDRVKELLKTWDALPAASAHGVTLEVRGGAEAGQLWLDGRYVGELPLKGPLKSCEIALAPGASLRGVSWPAAADARLLRLPLEAFARPGAMAGAEVAVTDAATLADRCLLVPGAGAPAIDVAGLGRLLSPSDDLVSFAWRRSSLDGLPETRVFSVPLDVYAHAYVLCAAEEDPTKTPAFTLRLTRYANSRGDALADTLVRLPAGRGEPAGGGPAGADARRAGSVSYGPAAARKTVPLWLVRVPLKNGLIQDLLRDDKRRGSGFPTHRYLDVELLDPLDGIDENDAFPPSLKPAGRTYVPRGPRSAVHVFGLSLEPAVASLTVRAGGPVNVFYAAEKPRWDATVDARRGGAYALAWEFADVDGTVVARGERPLSLAEGARETIAIPADVPVGWYAARFRLIGPAAAPGGPATLLADHRTSFVMLPPDTRKAGFESPHGAWWFHWAHGGEPNIERVGPVLQRAGLRHTILPKALPESITSKWGVTAWNVNWFFPRGKPDMPLAERLAAHETFIREELRLWPSMDRMMIWHESGGGGAAFPSELWGVTPPPANETVEKAWQVRMEYVTALAKMVREKFPNLKMQWGNDGSSLTIIAELLRRKMPRQYIDAIAVEDLGQTIIPEKAIPGGMQSVWFLRQTARKLGYADVPVTAAYEWIGRRDMALGTGGQAEWYVRDALQARAYGFAQIAIGTAHDAGAGYFHTIWGAGGLCRRYPEMAPKPSYAAMATLTRVLDGAKYERAVPTGSMSLYCLEFRRGEQWVYAAWVPRGRREAALRLAGPGEVRLVDLYGREATARGPELKLTASTAAQYVVSPVRAEGMTAGKSWFPDDAPPEKALVVDPLDSLDTFTLQPEKDKRLERTAGEYMPHRTMGRFEVRPVDDAEKGKCIEIELKPEGEVWEAMHEYAVLKFKEPVVAPGPYENLGVWLKGNSGWGEVMWEVQTEKGATWLTQGVYMDWPGHIAANFDGWNFVRLPLQADPAWRSKIKVTGLAVTLPRKSLYVTEMVPVKDLKIRLKGLCLF